ncbi:M61 family metallopeptidase [Puia sp. P3]|uniref:M61 family metallopeptidase n=1 Tax=Puia sp. P3 TaxID=3423952 RepID=UPI003D664F3D
MCRARGATVDLKMPAWMPGYYQLLDYAKNVQNFRAVGAAGKELGWEKISSNAWRVENPKTPITVNYDVVATKAFVAQPWLDSTRGYVAPAGVFLYVSGYIHEPVTVEVKPWSGWNKVATGLEPVAGRKNVYRARDFDILFDSPILTGNLDDLKPFTVRGVPHYFTAYKPGQFDGDSLMNDLKKIVQQGVDVIGDVPYTHYTFLAIGPGRGGIEHLNSSTIGFSGEALSKAGERQRTLCFIAHEYFHHFNVKRIRPIALGPFDYDRENRTNMLWVSEGLTVYYEYMLVRRAGLMSGQDLLQHFQSDIAAYENKTGHLYQSLAQSSYETWSEGPFGRTGDTVNKTISYYQKGPAVGLLLDMAIRHSTGNRKTLDDVMRTVYRTYYREKQRGFTDLEFRKVCESVAGADLSELFDYVYTVKEPDYAKYLAYGGLGIEAGEKTWKLYPLQEVDELQGKIRKDWMRE